MRRIGSHATQLPMPGSCPQVVLPTSHSCFLAAGPMRGSLSGFPVGLPPSFSAPGPEDKFGIASACRGGQPRKAACAPESPSGALSPRFLRSGGIPRPQKKAHAVKRPARRSAAGCVQPGEKRREGNYIENGNAEIGNSMERKRCRVDFLRKLR